MRLFQNYGVYPGYRPRLSQLTRHLTTFADKRAAFLSDRYGASHLLKPIYDDDQTSFFTNGDDEDLQHSWAQSQGMLETSSLEQILLAQIEHHRTEVFYNLDPMRYDSEFAKKLPGSVKRKLAWRAAPSPGADFGAYDLILGNFPSILSLWEKHGWRSAWFAPAHDPILDTYAANTKRPIDILFVGGYSRHHKRRSEILHEVASLSGRRAIRFHLDRSRLNKLAETPLGLIGPLAKHRRPKKVRAVTVDPVFGLELYSVLGSAKIVLNGAIDMARLDRGNMRCWEATGAGALLLTDAGSYPSGFVDNETMAVFSDAQDAAIKASNLLDRTDDYQRIANAGHIMIGSKYSKAMQWQAFQSLAS